LSFNLSSRLTLLLKKQQTNFYEPATFSKIH
jgi:hypothetical protein